MLTDSINNFNYNQIIIGVLLPMLLLALSLSIGMFSHKKTKINPYISYGIPLFLSVSLLFSVNFFELEKYAVSILEPIVLIVGLPLLGFFMSSPLLYLMFRKRS